MKNKKNIAKVGIVGAMLLGITECSMIVAPAAVAEFTQPQVQSLSVPKHFDMIDVIEQDAKFHRLNAEVITVAPWMKPETQAVILSDSELIAILKDAGFSGNGLAMAWAIVKSESTARPYAHNDNPKTGDNSYGLFQINMYKSLEASRQKAYGLESNEELFDPATNASIAFKISKGGTSWGAWTTHKNAKKIVNQFPG
jgi:hypothetical protein